MEQLLFPYDLSEISLTSLQEEYPSVKFTTADGRVALDSIIPTAAAAASEEFARLDISTSDVLWVLRREYNVTIRRNEDFSKVWGAFTVADIEAVPPGPNGMHPGRLFGPNGASVPAAYNGDLQLTADIEGKLRAWDASEDDKQHALWGCRLETPVAEVFAYSPNSATPARVGLIDEWASDTKADRRVFNGHSFPDFLDDEEGPLTELAALAARAFSEVYVTSLPGTDQLFALPKRFHDPSGAAVYPWRDPSQAWELLVQEADLGARIEIRKDIPAHLETDWKGMRLSSVDDAVYAVVYEEDPSTGAALPPPKAKIIPLPTIPVLQGARAQNTGRIARAATQPFTDIFSSPTLPSAGTGERLLLPAPSDGQRPGRVGKGEEKGEGRALSQRGNNRNLCAASGRNRGRCVAGGPQNVSILFYPGMEQSYHPEEIGWVRSTARRTLDEHGRVWLTLSHGPSAEDVNGKFSTMVQRADVWFAMVAGYAMLPFWWLALMLDDFPLWLSVIILGIILVIIGGTCSVGCRALRQKLGDLKPLSRAKKRIRQSRKHKSKRRQPEYESDTSLDHSDKEAVVQAKPAPSQIIDGSLYRRVGRLLVSPDQVSLACNLLLHCFIFFLFI